MSSIDKLLLQGVRSFGPDQHQVIKFEPGLTIILGPNGTGKTTVIEALKYVTTGKVPPNTSKNQWLFDPRLLTNTGTEARVSLRFKSKNGKFIAATRRMKVEHKKKKTTFQEISSELKEYRTLPDGTYSKEGDSVTVRSNDATDMIEARLGVSQAVLQHVIFCHQEESTWPLGDASTVKKIFDNIFEATRYTKVLKELKDSQKDLAAQNKGEVVVVRKLEEDKKTATDLKEQFAKSARLLQEKKAKIDENEAQLVPLTKRLKAVRHVQERMSGLESKLAVQQTQRKDKKKIVADLLKTMERMDDISVEQLEVMKHNFANDKTTNEREIKQAERAQRGLQGELDKTSKSLAKELQQLGGLQKSKADNEANVTRRDKRVETIATKRGIAGYTQGPYSSEQVTAFAQVLEGLAHDKERELSSLKSTWSEEKHVLDQRVMEVKSDIAKSDQKKETIEHSLSEIAKKKKQITKDAQKLGRGAASAQELKDNVATSAEQLQMAKTRLVEANFTRRIEEETRRKLLLDSDVKTLQEVQHKMHKQTEARTRIVDKEKTIAKNKASMQRIIEARTAELQEHFEVVQPTTVQSQYESCRVDLVNRRDETEAMQRTARREHTRAETAHANKSKELEILRARAQTSEEKISNECGDEAYETVLTRVTEQKEGSMMLPMIPVIYEKFVTAASNDPDHNCPVCKQKLADLDAFVASMNERIARANEKMQQDSTAAVAARHERLVQLKHTNDEWLYLRDNDLPAREAEFEDTQAAVEQTRTRLQEQDAAFEAAAAALEKLEQLQSDVNEIHRLHQTVKREAEELALEKDKLYDVDDRTPETIRKEIADKTESAHKAQQAIDGLKESRRELEKTVSDAKATKDNAEKKLSEQIRVSEKQEFLQGQLSTLEEEEGKLSAEMAELKVNAKPLQKRLKEASDHRMEQQRKFDDAAEDLGTHRRSLEDDKRNFDAISRQITQYIKDNKDALLDRCLGEKERLESETNKLSGELEEISNKTQALKESVAQAVNKERQLQDNLNYRRLESEIEHLTVLEGATEAELDKLRQDSTFRDQKKLNDEFRELQEQTSALRGETTQMQRDLTQQQTTLKKFGRAEAQYREGKIKVSATEFLIKDIATYYTALDNAVMRFHAMKLTEINSSMRRLWEKTYRGGDIDYIEIQTEPEETGTTAADRRKAKEAAAAAAATASRRSYNYRVVMAKGGVKLDMRGRCSAGQKVLACIIIRLALADTFCIDCGVLTLDEPTTNLDEDNVESLAEALAALCKERKRQQNFQLIIITHDEEFVRILGRSGIADQFYALTKEPLERNNSVLVSTLKRSNMQNLGSVFHEAEEDASAASSADAERDRDFFN